MKLLSFWSILLLLLLCRSAALTAEEQHREHRDLIIDVTTLPFIGGYEVCVGFESQVVAIWTYVLYLILGPFFDATIGPCIGRDGWVWADVGDSCATACGKVGGVCGIEQIRSINSEATFQFVESKYQDLVEFNCGDDYIDSNAAGVPFTEFSTSLNRLLCTYTTSTATTCGDVVANGRRICCCDASACETSP